MVQSTISAAVLDVSPGQCLIPPGALNPGTRVRIVAHGSYIASTTASTMAFGFYMNQAGSTILTTPAVLTLGPAITAVVATMPWRLDYFGRIAAASATTGTAASIVGGGEFTYTTTSWTATYTKAITPQTVGARTVAQTATGLITYTEQNVFAGCTVTTGTGLTSITCDELTCELLG
jgi:hypothetical protein